MSDFVMPSDSGPLPPRPSVVGAPSEDGPIIYPAHLPGDPDNVTPFQKETGLDPAKLPSLKDALGPKLRLLPGGAGGPNPAAQPVNNPQNLPSTAAIVAGRRPQFAAGPGDKPAASADVQVSYTTATLVVAGIAFAAYLLGKNRAASAFNGPLVADMDEASETED